MLECESRSRPGLPEIHILDKAKCGLVAGQKMLIPTLTDIEAALVKLTPGAVTSGVAFRALVAEPFGADGCCTFATNKALRSIAEAACACLLNGDSPVDVLPFWRVIDSKSTIAKRLQLDAERLRTLLSKEIESDQ
jgi:hypothetical protein